MLQPKLAQIESLHNYKLRLVYQTGEATIFGSTPYLTGSRLGQLWNQAYLKQVHFLPDGTEIEWPGGQDIALHELYGLGVTITGVSTS
jgi:hypothetical protein